MTYYINTENTGLETDEQVAYMAEKMQGDGHDVKATRDFGLINSGAESGCPVDDRQWMRYLEEADANA